MAVFAFQLAEDWFRKSSKSITPLQYGLLFNMCAISSFKSAYQCLRYLASGTRAKASRLLRKAVVVLVFLLTFVRLIALTDLLLHHYTTSGPLITRPVGLASSSNRSSIPNYGTRVYDFWDEDNPAPCSFRDYLILGNCSFLGSNNGTGRWGNRALFSEGFATSSNSSEKHQVVPLNHNHSQVAVVVRPVVDAKHSYTASTIGMSATCRPLTSQCTFGPRANTTAYRIDFNCTKAGRAGFEKVPALSPTTPSNFLWIVDNFQRPLSFGTGGLNQQPSAKPSFNLTGIFSYPGLPGLNTCTSQNISQTLLVMANISLSSRVA